MRKFTLTVATTLLVAACQDAMQPVPGTKPEFVAGGSDYECAGSATGTFDNIVVPPGEDCGLFNATVQGNVTALKGLGSSCSLTSCTLT